MFKKVLKYLLWTVVIVCLWLFSWFIALFFSEPGWVTWVIFLSILGVAGAVFFLQRIWTRSRARMLALRNIIVAPTAGTDAAPIALRHKWRDGIASLQNSALKKAGDPIYALPWYLTLGATGSGKTAALIRARLESPLMHIDPGAHIEPTSNLDWFFFDRAVVLDLAGRFADHAASDSASAEWEDFLGLLAKARRREPLNGIVLTIEADKLRAGNNDQLQEAAWFLRRRIAQLMTLMNTRFPVYVLVTKVDQLYGLNVVAHRLPGHVLRQPMGFAADEGVIGPVENPVRTFIDDAFKSVIGTLKDLRLAVLQRTETPDPGLIVFPNELEQLRPGLEHFMNGIFGEDAYVETPWLRGLFFSSSEQTGTESSTLINDINPAAASRELPGTTTGIFLHDVFARILPEDRHRHRPLTVGWQWDRITQNLGLGSWAVFNLAVAVVLSFSFLGAFQTVEKARSLYPSFPEMSGTLQEDLPKLDKFREFIKWMGEREESVLAHWTPFHRIVERLQEAFKADFVRDFSKFVVPETEDLFDRRVNTVGKDDPSYPFFIHFLTTRVNLNLTRSRGENYDQLRRMPAPSPKMISLLDSRLDSKLGGTFSELYVANVAWKNWDVYQAIKLVDLRTQLDSLVEHGSPNMNWLVQWANQDPSLHSVDLDDFWPGSGTAGGEIKVQPAYSASGRRAIYEFISQLETATRSSDTLRVYSRNFNGWYEEQESDAWYRFAVNFDQGRQRVMGEVEWRQLLPIIGSPRDPYFALLSTMSRTLGAHKDVPPPPWLVLASRFDAMRVIADRAVLLGNTSSIAGVVNRSAWDIFMDALAGRPDRSVAKVKQSLDETRTCQSYLSGLNAIARDTSTNAAQSEKIDAGLYAFSSNPKADPSALYSLYETVADLKHTLTAGGAPDDPVIWSLVDGPLRFVREYTDRQTACYLQSQWTSNVLWPLNKVATKTEVSDQLYGPKGTVWDFVEGPSSPFVLRNARNYTPVTMLGGQIPFTPDFFAFLNRANGQNVASALQQKRDSLRQQQKQLLSKDRMAAVDDLLGKLKPKMAALSATRADVNIQGYPSNVNSGAQVFPFATYLTLQCAGAPMTLANYNFPVQKIFNWSPSSCGDTSLKVEFQGGLVLTRRYPGPYGFADFIKEFYDGRHQFTAADFPDQAQRMTALGITKITLFFSFSGQDEVLALQSESQSLPDRIAQLEGEQKQLQNQQQAAQAQDIDTQLDSIDHVEPISGNIPSKITECWSSPTIAASGDLPAARILRIQGR